MNGPNELKILFAGPMGAGKTTAIRNISDAPPVSTEAFNSERHACDKVSTTVSLDFGQLQLADGTAIRLYGTPGQERFAFMWNILARNALGLILLIDGSHASASADLQAYARKFQALMRGSPLVVGVGRLPSGADAELDHFSNQLASQGIIAPVYGVDVRRREDVLLLVETLLCILESRIGESVDETC